MKQCFAILIFISIFYSARGQQQQQQIIEKQFLTYINLLVEKKFNQSFAFIIDDLFKLIPKDTLLIIMEETLNNKDYSFVIDSPKVIHVSNVKKIENHYYARINYSCLLYMKYYTDATDNLSSDSTMNRVLQSSLVQTFGSNNVHYNTEKERFTIYTTKDAIARSDDGKVWKFIDVDQQQLPFLRKFIPAELLKSTN